MLSNRPKIRRFRFTLIEILHSINENHFNWTYQLKLFHCIIRCIEDFEIHKFLSQTPRIKYIISISWSNVSEYFIVQRTIFVVKKCKRKVETKLPEKVNVLSGKISQFFKKLWTWETATTTITRCLKKKKKSLFLSKYIEIKNTVCEEIMIFCAYNKRKIRFQQHVDIIDVSISVYSELNRFEKDIKNYIESTVFGFPS